MRQPVECVPGTNRFLDGLPEGQCRILRIGSDGHVFPVSEPDFDEESQALSRAAKLNEGRDESADHFFVFDSAGQK